MTDKPFKGVISNWRRDGEVIVGDCMWHRDARDKINPEAVLNDQIVRGCGIHTSRIERLDHRGSFVLCETKNSIYVLVDAA